MSKASLRRHLVLLRELAYEFDIDLRTDRHADALLVNDRLALHCRDLWNDLALLDECRVTQVRWSFVMPEDLVGFGACLRSHLLRAALASSHERWLEFSREITGAEMTIAAAGTALNTAIRSGRSLSYVKTR